MKEKCFQIRFDELIVGLVVLFLVACSSQNPIETPVSTIFNPTETINPNATQTETPIPTATITNIPTTTSTTAPSPTALPTTTVVQIPSSFSEYSSAEISAKWVFDPVLFSVRYPTNWVTGWLQDEGITAFSIMSDADAWKVPSGVWLMIILARANDVDLQAYKDSFRGWAGNAIGETTINGLKLVETVYNNGEVLQLSTIIQGEDPNEGVIVAANMPLSGETIYRPLMEQLITSIKVHSKIPNAVITADPATGPLPPTAIFALSEFQPNETLHVTIYIDPPPYWNNLRYETTLTVDENGVGEFSLASEDWYPTGEFPGGEYLVRAAGYAGSYAEILVTYK